MRFALPITLARMRRGITFLASFGLAKGLAFGAVLLLPRLLDPVSYGAVELALSVGLFGAGILGLGVVGAAARMHLVDGERHTEPLLAAICGWSALAGFLIGAGAVVAGAGAAWALCLFACGLFAFQLAATGYVRFRGHIHVAGWFDHAAILAFTLSASILWLFGSANVAGMTWAAAVLSAGAVGAAVALAWSRGATLERDLVVRAIRIGWPIMLNGLILSALSGSQRIVIAKALTLADVALFSVCLRLATVLLIVHQVATTGLFQRVYRLSKDRIDSVFALWTIFIVTFACAITLAFHVAAPWLVHGTGVDPRDAAHVFPAIAAMTTFWIFSANVEMFVGRELLAGRVAPIVVAVMAAFAAIGGLVSHVDRLSLIAICLLYAGATAMAVLAQMIMLRRADIRFRRAYATLPLGFAPLLAYLA